MNSAVGVLLLLVSGVLTTNISEILEEWDWNSDGFLDRAELPMMDDLPDYDWGQLKNQMDVNSDDKISKKEYEDYAKIHSWVDEHGDMDAFMRRGMQALDLNNNGYLEQSEVPPVGSAYQGVSNEQWIELQRQADRNNDDLLSFDEYISFLRRAHRQKGIARGYGMADRGNSTLTGMTRSSAEMIISAAVAKSEELDVVVTIAVVDSGANLVSIVRMDDAWLGSVDLSLRKARTAALFNLPTGPRETLWAMTEIGGPLYNTENSNNGLITRVGGGVPVRNEEGRVVGAVGVAGSRLEANDREVAEAAVQAVL